MIEFPLLRPGPACALHLLLTLSERFSIALCTKPPRPLVGDAGRSTRPGESRPCEGDIAKGRAIEIFSPTDGYMVDGGSNLRLFVVGIGDRTPPADAGDAELEYLCPSPEMLPSEPSLDGDAEGPLSRAEIARSSGSAVLSLEIPGKRLIATIDAVPDESSRLLLNAADPDPRSCVCLNQVGSFDRKESAIWLLEMPLSSFSGVQSTVAGGDFEAFRSEATTDNGRLLEPVDSRDEGRRCQERVPARKGVIGAL